MQDWTSVLRTVFVSRALDALEETRLLPERKVLYQFCARGHDVTQVLLGQQLTGRRDGVSPYYRSRPLALTLGVTAEEALASTMMRAEGMSGGRDVGVVINRPNRDGPCLLPACGGVGTQYTPATGWAQALRYRARVLKDPAVAGCIAVAHGGEASTSTNGFWASLNIATTERLPLLYFIEDNGYGISVPAARQTPGGDIAANLAAFGNLRILSGEGSDPIAAAALIATAVSMVRSGDGPVLLRLRVPRLSGHSGQDTQAYKEPQEIESERARDPLLALRRRLVPGEISEAAWQALEAEAGQVVEEALKRIESRPQVSAATVARFAFTERRADGSPELQAQGGQWADGVDAAGRRRDAETGGRPHQHADRDPPHARARARDQPARAGVRRGRGAERRRACGDARAPGTLRRGSRLRHQPVGGRHHRPCGRHGPGRARAGARDPVPQVCGAGGGAAARLRHDPLAHGEPFRRADGRAHARRLLQVRRSLAQPVQRGAVPACGRLAARDAVERGGRGGPAAHGAARQRAGDLLRAPVPAGRRGRTPALAR